MPNARVKGRIVRPVAFGYRIVVRRATIKDLDQVVALRLALLREEAQNPFFANPHPDAATRAIELTRGELAMPGEVFLVAEIDEAIVGILRCRLVRRMPLVASDRQAVVTTVYVVPQQRRRGVLSALLSYADRWCRRQGVSDMRLQCALSNEIGQKAWEALGFKPAETLYLRTIPND